jgi:hypothetical protein
VLKQEPNIAFIGEGAPFTSFVTPREFIELPQDQSKPFYHERAAFIIQTWPNHYKPVISKGVK